MAEGKTLKEQNAWLIRAVMLAHITAFILVAIEPLGLFSLSADALAKRLEAAAAPGAASLGLIVVASLLLLGLIPANWRDRLIHWRWSHPLPGARAFSVIGPASSRVDMTVLENRFGPLPMDPGEQDRLFYKVYRQHRDEVGVLDAHRSYLAARDIGTINALLMISLPWLAWASTGDVGRAAAYAAFLVAAYALSAVAAKNYGTRLVQNVLCLASDDRPGTEESENAANA